MLNSTKIRDRFVASLLDHPWRWLFLLIGLTLFCALGIAKIKQDYSPRVWFGKNHEEIINLNQFEKLFGSDQSIVIGVYNENGIFNEKTLKTIQDISWDMGGLPEIRRVESLSTTVEINSKDDEILINKILHSGVDYSKNSIEQIKKNVMGNKDVIDIFVSQDAKLTVIYGYLNPFIGRNPEFKPTIDGARELIKKYQKNSDDQFHLSGNATAIRAFQEVAQGDNKKIIPILLFSIIMVLFLTFRGFTSIFLPFALVAVTVLSTMGLIGHFGFIFNSLLSATPAILLAICLADSVHILSKFVQNKTKGMSSKDAIEGSLKINFVPTVLTSISTAISFFSFSLSDIQPLSSLGIVAGCGTILAWLYTYLLMGPFIKIVGPVMDKSRFSPKFNVKFKFDWREGLTRFIEKNARLIVLAFFILSTVSVYFALQNEVNSDPLKYFSNKVPVKKAYDFISSKFQGVRSVNLMIDSGSEGGVKDAAFLTKIDDFVHWAETDPDITHGRSILDVIKRMNQVIHNDDPKFYRVPETREQTSELLLLYSMGLPQGKDINDLVSIDERYMRIHVLWKIETTRDSAEKFDKLISKAGTMGIDAKKGGNMGLHVRMNTMIVKSFFRSMSIALFLVGLLILAVFRDLKISIIAMFPNIVPLFVALALIKLTGQFLDIGTSLVASVCLGIAVDDTIHFVTSYQLARKEGRNPLDSINFTFKGTGVALVITTVLLVLGFGSFGFAEFIPNRNFGILSAIVLLFALITDLLLLPAIFYLVDQKKGKN
ncbi:MAG: MMPL family transporter [Bacteriovoracaceae bacterium]|jgi:uncharacterized protein|nr:MMPL family transporter [Bacteriovoracaceae bacterium]